MKKGVSPCWIINDLLANKVEVESERADTNVPFVWNITGIVCGALRTVILAGSTGKLKPEFGLDMALIRVFTMSLEVGRGFAEFWLNISFRFVSMVCERVGPGLNPSTTAMTN